MESKYVGYCSVCHDYVEAFPSTEGGWMCMECGADLNVDDLTK